MFESTKVYGILQLNLKKKNMNLPESFELKFCVMY